MKARQLPGAMLSQPNSNQHLFLDDVSPFRWGSSSKTQQYREFLKEHS